VTAGCRCLPGHAGTIVAADDATVAHLPALYGGSCEPCEYGQYQPDEGSDACLACGAGHQTEAIYATDGGAVSAFAQEGATACIGCAAGRYSMVSSWPACQLCGAGKHQPQTGQPTCADCVAGYSQAREGALQCDGCTAGRYSEDTGATACTACTGYDADPRSVSSPALAAAERDCACSAGYTRCVERGLALPPTRTHRLTVQRAPLPEPGRQRCFACDHTD
jgi:hypothetical protein